MKEEEHQTAHFTLHKATSKVDRMWEMHLAHVHGSCLVLLIHQKSSDLAKFKALEHSVLGMFCSSFTIQEVLSLNRNMMHSWAAVKCSAF